MLWAPNDAVAKYVTIGDMQMKKTATKKYSSIHSNSFQQLNYFFLGNFKGSECVTE